MITRVYATGKLDVTLAQLARMAPGGSVRITAAASRFISMQQQFDPPLVIGYLGFDAPCSRMG